MPPIRLALDDGPIIFGKPVKGKVLLDFNLVKKDEMQVVYVELKGRIFIEQTTRTVNSVTITRWNSIDLMERKISLWKRGRAYPPAGSHILPLPFEIPLGVNLPPNFERTRDSWANLPHRMEIIYTLHVIGKRPGLFKLKENIKQPLTIQHHDTVSAPIQTRLNNGWDKPWMTVRGRETFRKYLLCGSEADVDVRVSISHHV
ncbi:hypothetical protein DAEQUDRAFT_675681 [Daedalea quercina L-15889]|uniref:Arrestin-like N-terminal domain-containing protein n=1 Tax=Daedalea quercina L-15889 TaxID=1314783 RepID=A0A165MTE8_9APHY|nr:hypothetical protein DAEQUDRAFT_675681 [Daedalea quercina L-15889]